MFVDSLPIQSSTAQDQAYSKHYHTAVLREGEIKVDGMERQMDRQTDRIGYSCITHSTFADRI